LSDFRFFKDRTAMANIVGIQGMSPQQLAFELQRGGKFVQYQYCVSALVITFKRGTDIYFIAPGENPTMKGLGWTFLSLLAGWWGIPWGPIYTVQSLWANLRGGRDLTPQAASALQLPIDQSALYPDSAKSAGVRKRSFISQNLERAYWSGFS
jgi:hypothetical protein